MCDKEELPQVLAASRNGDLRYERIFMFSHRDQSALSSNAVLRTETGNVLRASPGHYVWATRAAPSAMANRRLCSKKARQGYPTTAATPDLYSNPLECQEFKVPLWQTPFECLCEQDLRQSAIVSSLRTENDLIGTASDWSFRLASIGSFM